MAFWSWLFGTKSDPGTNPGNNAEAVNLRRWQESGEALRWVQARQGQWSHDDWLELLSSLQGSIYWPMEPDAVGVLLEELKQKSM